MLRRTTRSQSRLPSAALDVLSPETRGGTSGTGFEHDDVRPITRSRKRKASILAQSSSPSKRRSTREAAENTSHNEARQDGPSSSRAKGTATTRRSQASTSRSQKARMMDVVPVAGKHNMAYVELPLRKKHKGKHQTIVPAHVYESDGHATTRRLKSSDDASSPSTVAVVQGETSVYRQDLTIRMRERIIKRREMDLNNMEGTLAERSANLELEELEIAALKTTLQASVSRSTREKHIAEMRDIISTLDEHFKCVLCYEVIALPHTLFAYKCGHSFCALCLLKWACSLMHECGSWHAPITCPTCRSAAQIPIALFNYDLPERPLDTCLFVLNRAHNDVLESFVRKLCNLGNELRGIIITERIKTPESVLSLLDWAVHGSAYDEWQARKNRGQIEMGLLIDRWATISFDHLRSMKERLRNLN